MEDTDIITEALAEHFGVSKEEVGGYVVGCEYRTPEDGMLHFRTVYVYRTPWDLKGYMAEMQDQMRQDQAQAHMASLVAEAVPEGA